MQVRVTQSFLAALSLLGVLALPSAASAHDEDEGYYGNRRGMQRGYYNSPYTDRRERLQLQRSLRRNSRNYYDRYSYNNDHFGNRWYGGRRHYGNRYDQGKNCKLPRRSYESGNQYGPRYYGNDYYGYAR